jgi:hypothetical protein
LKPSIDQEELTQPSSTLALTSFEPDLASEAESIEAVEAVEPEILDPDDELENNASATRRRRRRSSASTAKQLSLETGNS